MMSQRMAAAFISVLRGLLFGRRAGDFVVVILVIIMVIEALFDLRGSKVIFERPHWRRGHIVVTVLLFISLFLILLLWEVKCVFWLGSWKTGAEWVSYHIIITVDFGTLCNNSSCCGWVASDCPQTFEANIGLSNIERAHKFFLGFGLL